MATFQYDAVGAAIALGIHDHGSRQNGGWNPVTAGRVVVASVVFPVSIAPQGRIVEHCVVHVAGGVAPALIAAPIDMASQIVVLQCSGGLSSVAGAHECVELIHNAQTKEAVVLRMKNRSAFEQVTKWLPQFLTLRFEEAKQIAGAADREALSGLEARYGQLLDVVVPLEAKAMLAALSILCQGYLAVWASSRLKTTEDRNAVLGKPVGDALDTMGWSKIDPSSLPPDLPTKMDDLSKRTWWQQCFGKKFGDLVNSELKGKLNETTYVKDLVAWIDDGRDETISSRIVAGAFGELHKELGCHD